MNKLSLSIAILFNTFFSHCLSAAEQKVKSNPLPPSQSNDIALSCQRYSVQSGNNDEFTHEDKYSSQYSPSDYSDPSRHNRSDDALLEFRQYPPSSINVSSNGNSFFRCDDKEASISNQATQDHYPFHLVQQSNQVHNHTIIGKNDEFTLEDEYPSQYSPSDYSNFSDSSRHNRSGDSLLESPQYAPSSINLSSNRNLFFRYDDKEVFIWNKATLNGYPLDIDKDYRKINLRDHIDRINCISLSNIYFATGGRDKKVCIWTYNSDTGNYSCIWAYGKHEGEVLGMYFLDSNQIASVSSDGCLHFIRVKENVPLRKIKRDVQFTSVSVSFQGQYLVIGDDEGMLRLWTKKNLTSILDKRWCYKIVIHGYMRKHAKHITDDIIQIILRYINMDKMCDIRKKERKSKIVRVLASHNGLYIASCSIDGILNIFRVTSKELILENNYQDCKKGINDISFSPRDLFIFASSYSTKIHRFLVKKHLKLGGVYPPCKNTLYTVFCLRNGDPICCGIKGNILINCYYWINHYSWTKSNLEPLSISKIFEDLESNNRFLETTRLFLRNHVSALNLGLRDGNGFLDAVLDFYDEEEFNEEDAIDDLKDLDNDSQIFEYFKSNNTYFIEPDKESKILKTLKKLYKLLKQVIPTTINDDEKSEN